MRLSIGILATAALSAQTPNSLRSTVTKYCLGCHVGTAAKGGIDLSGVRDPKQIAARLDLWHKVGQIVEAQQMPPHGVPQPAEKEREQLLTAIDSLLATGAASRPGPAITRRLTRLEYNNTVRDLLGLDRDLFILPERLPYASAFLDPSRPSLGKQVTVNAIEYGQKIPVLLRYSSLLADGRAEHGFSNRHDSLNVSALGLEKYLAVASEVAASPDLPQRSSIVRLLLAPAGLRTPVETARLRLTPLVERAFRRPVSAEDVSPFVRIFEDTFRRDANFEAAMRSALRALLASPGLIYLAESSGDAGSGARPRTSFELASKLSYFLWSSAPDTELLALAREDLLTREEVLVGQALRMLRDPRARAMTETFGYQWLQLNELQGARPDPDKFPKFYRPDVFGTLKFNLSTDMLTEALLLLQTVLIEDRPVIDFVDARYTWVNEWLASHYGIADRIDKEWKRDQRRFGQSASSQWYRVDLNDARRGGVLTMGATLTMNATPVRSSPVFRGAWALEVLFNRPPPPPPNVAFPPLDESGADVASLSLRQQVELHRKNPACASCHNRMDPLGFALENFDGSGSWRTTEGKHPIDPAGSLSHGRKFRDITEFKSALTARPADFVGGFAEHMLSYALNRKLEYYDTAAVQKIVQAAAAEQYRYSAILRGVVISRPFRYIDATETKESQ